MGRTATKEEKEKGGWLSRAGRMFEKILKRFFVRKHVQRWWFIYIYESIPCSKHDIEVCFLFWQSPKSVCWFICHCNCIDQVFLGGWQSTDARKMFSPLCRCRLCPINIHKLEITVGIEKSCFFQWRWLGIPSWKITYPLTRDFWKWFSFSPGGICYFPGSTSLRNSHWMQQRVRSHVTVPRYVYPVFEAVDASWNIFMSIESYIYIYLYISNI